MSDFEPGDMAVATVRGVPNVRIMATSSVEWVTMDGYAVSDRDGETMGNVANIRPLVVLDIDDVPLTLAALDQAVEATGRGFVSARIRRLHDAIEAQTKPPKPAEPTGLGAVVEDAAGDKWVRCRRSGHQGLLGVEWENERTCGHLAWSGIAAARVLSEGVA